jgi:outer membrane protein W
MQKMGKAFVAALGLLAVAAAPSTSARAGDSNGNFQVKVGVSGVLTDDHTNSLSINGSPNLAPSGYRATTDDMIILDPDAHVLLEP